MAQYISNMNPQQFYTACINKDYKDNPEIAKQLYNYSKDGVSEALKGKDSRTLSTDEFIILLTTYWWNFGLRGTDTITQMLRFLSSDWRNDNLRVEFDEEYVEYGFLAVEDGGRGIKL